MTDIDGQKHPLMKLLADIQNETGRRRNNLFFAEGWELAERAFKFGADIHSLIVARESLNDLLAKQLLQEAASRNIEVYSAGSGLIGKVLKAKPVPPCLALARIKRVKLDDVFFKSASLVIGVEHGENADNLGMLLRSADAAGVDGVVLCAQTVDPFNRRTVRGSRGAVFSLRICVKHSMRETLTRAKEAGFKVVASSAHAEPVYSGVDMTCPVFLIVGNEHKGVSKDTLSDSDAVLRVPMLGRIGSLNIAVAASILMYEARRQRGWLS